MSSSNVPRNDRLSAGPFRAPLAVAGAALLGLSLLLSVGPALAAANHSNGNGANGNGNGTSGNVKVHDATSGVETAGNGNEPRVCDFWLEFTSDTPEAGTWTVVSWAPTGDGSTVASGAYDTSVDGVDNSGIIELPAGHYRVEWAATGQTVTNKKTFWVDAGCDQAVTPVDEPPVDEPPPPPDESGSEEPASPAEDPASPGGVPPSEEAAPTDDESPAEDPAAPSDESAGEGSVLSNEGSSPEDPGTASDESPVGDSPAEEPATQAQEPVSGDPSTPSDEAPATPGDPSEEEHAAQATDPGTVEPPAPPAGDQLGSAVASGGPTMADTAAPTVPVPSGLLATFGLLLLIVAHATTRRGTLGHARA